MKKTISILAGILLIVVAVGFFAWQKNQNGSAEKQLTETAPTSNETQSARKNVPLPTEEDVIRLFFSLINEQQIPEAIAMMSPTAVPNESARQAWGVQFNNITSILVTDLQPSNEAGWTEQQHVYQATLDVAVSPEAANAPIPYYGWGENPNFRWIPIEKNASGQWQIVGLTTGP